MATLGTNADISTVSDRTVTVSWVQSLGGGTFDTFVKLLIQGSIQSPLVGRLALSGLENSSFYSVFTTIADQNDRVLIAARPTIQTYLHGTAPRADQMQYGVTHSSDADLDTNFDDALRGTPIGGTTMTFCKDLTDAMNFAVGCEMTAGLAGTLGVFLDAIGFENYRDSDIASVGVGTPVKILIQGMGATTGWTARMAQICWMVASRQMS